MESKVLNRYEYGDEKPLEDVINSNFKEVENLCNSINKAQEKMIYPSVTVVTSDGIKYHIKKCEIQNTPTMVQFVTNESLFCVPIRSLLWFECHLVEEKDVNAQ